METPDTCLCRHGVLSDRQIVRKKWIVPADVMRWELLLYVFHG